MFPHRKIQPLNITFRILPHLRIFRVVGANDATIVLPIGSLAVADADFLCGEERLHSALEIGLGEALPIRALGEELRGIIGRSVAVRDIPPFCGHLVEQV
jgi:hypothetical protein